MSFKNLILHVGEIGCYFGPIVSLFISWKLVRMRNINLMNKMFLIFFLLESIFGTFETAFLFDLNDHRYFFMLTIDQARLYIVELNITLP